MRTDCVFYSESHKKGGNFVNTDEDQRKYGITYHKHTDWRNSHSALNGNIASSVKWPSRRSVYVLASVLDSCD